MTIYGESYWGEEFYGSDGNNGLKPHKDKLSGDSYSIGMSKHIPKDSIGLAYISAPEIAPDNISIVKEEVGIRTKEEYSERDNLHYAKNGANFVTDVSTQDILVTDEFSIKKYSDEVPEPLFYRATLKRNVNGANIANNSKYVPYQYGYTLKTEDMIKADNTSSDKSDVTPLIYKETYESGYNNLVSITMDDGKKVLSGFKIRMVRQGGSEYAVTIYNNFDQDKVYKVTYIDKDGKQTTEILESSLIFSTKSPSTKGWPDNYSATDEEIGAWVLGWTMCNGDESVPYSSGIKNWKKSADGTGLTSTLPTAPADPSVYMSTEYAVMDADKKYRIFAPTQMMNITDENRKPFEFKYRVLANLNGNYSKSNPAEVKVGIVFLSQNVSEDLHSLLVAFRQSIGTWFPEYISFINPHPPLRYATQNDEYKDAPEYWDVDLTAPQDYVNDYDIIFITGYGTHDLSAFNEKLKGYLEAGGKIIIDNLSNDNLEIFNVSFGSDPIIAYTMATPAMTGNKEFGTVTGYTSRHYATDNSMANNIAYVDSGTVIGPTITLVGENSTQWEDIIKYSSGSRSVAVKTYDGKGKILLSNCGILKAFSNGDLDEAKKFIVNTVLVLAEDIWRVTPWIYDRVYHKNQLYKHEYSIDSYVTDISPLGGNQIVAKKILTSNISNMVSYYTGVYGLTGKYFIEAYERDNSNNFIPLTSVYLPITVDNGKPLYAFARSTNNTSFNITSVDGYEDSNIYPYSAPVAFKVAITPITYRWINVDGIITQERVEAGEINRVKIPFTIDKNQGFINLGLLSTLLPPLPSGPDWADKSKIFFRVDISGAEDIGGSFLNTDENRINLYIYDKFTGKYIYTSDSDNVISYNDLYRWRVTERKDTGGVVMSQCFNDIIVQASTNYYELVASKRVYAIVNNATKTNVLKIPEGLNTNESWFPRIRYMRFNKSTFNKDDYDRISKTIGFRYDKDYILAKAKEYFGATPEDDKVAEVIAKLDNDEIVDANDQAILAEAFDIMSEEAVYEYDMKEYFAQAWDEYPYKSIRDEYAKYINASTIGVQYTPMNITRGTRENEVLESVAPGIYRSQNENWLPSMQIDIQIETEVSGVWESVVEGFSIDYSNGVVMFNETPQRTVRASYYYSNLKVTKKTYMNTVVNTEELTKLQDRIYIIANAINRVILVSPNPQVTVRYTDGQTKVLAPGSYMIDYNLGTVTTKDIETGIVYMTYSYANVEYIEVRDYDMAHGMLELSRNVHFNDNIYVSYSYREDYYEYKGYYDSQYKKFMYVDLNPTRGHECTYPVVVNGNVEYKETPTYKLLGKTLYLYLLPNKIARGNTVTVNDITIRHTFDKEDLVLMQMAHPELIIIGSIKIVNNYTPYDVITLDIRKRGGGLKESITNERIEKTDELSLNLWDIAAFDGRSYHPNGITVVKLPKEILVENGGKFTQDDVTKTVGQHLALGVMPIIKYY